MNWRRSMIGAAIAFPLLGLFAFGLTRDPNEIPSPLPGKDAPDFQLVRMDRGFGLEDPLQPTEVTLKGHLGEVVVLNFWASWCLACRYEHAALSDVAERYEGRGVVFYGVLYNDRADNARRWIEDMGGQSYATLLDPNSRTAIDYGLYGVPETFFIGKDGKVAYKQVGPVTEPMLIERIEALLQQDVEVQP